MDSTKNLKEQRIKYEEARIQTIEKFEENGVQFVCIDGVDISPLAEIEQGVVIFQGTIIRGSSKIGKNTVLGPNTIIDNSIIGEDCVINSTQIHLSTLENNISTGPFCHIRPNCVIKSGAHLGNFVEVKNSTVGENVSAGHLAYIGDSDVGKNVNYSCGAITANYDGVNKARCNIGEGAFIGSNVNIVAPVKIGEDGFIAAGSTITKDVPDRALAICRARELKVIEDGAVGKYKKAKSYKK